MDATRFTEAKTGQLMQVSTEDGPDYAFIPDPLPPNWEFPGELWPLLADAREQLARLDEKGRNFKNPTLLLEPLQKREALRSSSMEGTYATAKELLLFELAHHEPSSRKEEEAKEIANYDEALKCGVRHLKDKTADGLPLSKRLIQDMHKILLEGVRGEHGLPGEFRTKYVYVGSSRRYVPPPPGEPLLKCVNDLEDYLHNHGTKYHPLVLSYLVHYQFEAIHPFRDGNGRIGRLLLALTTYQWNDLSLPWLYMSAYFEKWKDEYVDNMFRVSTHGDWNRWIEFCLRGTSAQCKDAIRRCDALSNLRERMHQALDGEPRMGRLIEALFINPIFTAMDFAKWTHTSMPTARRDIEQLEKAGFVEHLSGERPRFYFVPEIFRAAYSEESGVSELQVIEPDPKKGG